jgi:hypothetical protein
MNDPNVNGTKAIAAQQQIALLDGINLVAPAGHSTSEQSSLTTENNISSSDTSY